MRFLPLLWAGIWRRPGRTVLTLLSVVTAFVLFGVLQGFSAGLSQLVSRANADLLVTTSRVSEMGRLPVAMATELQRVPGVRAVARVVHFGGPLRGETDFVRGSAVLPQEIRAVAGDLYIKPEQWAALERTKAGALISSGVAELYGLKIGDTVPLRPNMWANREGEHRWPVQVVGIYPENRDHPRFGQGVIVNYGYVDEGRAEGAGTTNEFNVRIVDPRQAGEVAAAIDRAFANSANETSTYSQRQLAMAAVNQMGDVGLAVRLITAAVFFALLFSVGSVMVQSGRERTSELAVLKTVGFTDGAVLTLVLAEAIIFCLAAAAVGLALSAALFPVIAKLMHFNLQSGPVMGVGLIVALLLALITGALPAWRAARLSIVDALAGR